MSMLAPEPMLEANLFVLEPDLEAVTAALARMEALHLEDVAPEGWTPSPEWTELANRYSSLTLRLSEMLNALGCKRSLDWNQMAICTQRETGATLKHGS